MSPFPEIPGKGLAVLAYRCEWALLMEMQPPIMCSLYDFAQVFDVKTSDPELGSWAAFHMMQAVCVYFMQTTAT